MNYNIIAIVLSVFNSLIGLYLLYFQSYFKEKGKNLATSEDIEKLNFLSEKGKNLATSEDIEELTLKVESVKQQFIEKNATIKANLDLLTNLQITHRHEEKTALVELNNKLHKWIALLTEGKPSVLDSDNNESINSKLHYLDLVYLEFVESQASFFLYVKDSNLLDAITNLQHSIIRNLSEHPRIYLIESQRINDLLKISDSVADSEIKFQRKKKLFDERTDILKTYQNNMIESLKLNEPYYIEYLTLIKTYFINLNKN